MQRVHLIAIGGASMHNLAIAISKKSNFVVTGSDVEILEPALSQLKAAGLLPDKMGWNPESIHKGLSAVILGNNATSNNPELLKAKELGLKMYSLPEYMYLQTRSKTRIVVAGDLNKTITTAMVLFVLKKLRIDTDYIVNADMEGFDNRIKLSYESRIAVFEGDECHTSVIDDRPKFHFYKPQIAVITGIQWNSCVDNPNFETYLEQFTKFIDLMEVQGRLICYKNDENLNTITAKLRRDIVAFNYNTPAHEVRNGITYLKTKKAEIALKVSGEQNLQNIEGARLACKQIGVTDDQFYSAIGEFK
ncbi:MAG: Mur ligase domain-containing protein [Paludibacter sp.]